MGHAHGQNMVPFDLMEDVWSCDDWDYSHDYVIGYNEPWWDSILEQKLCSSFILSYVSEIFCKFWTSRCLTYVITLVFVTWRFWCNFMCLVLYWFKWLKRDC